MAASAELTGGMAAEPILSDASPKPSHASSISISKADRKASWPFRHRSCRGLMDMFGVDRTSTSHGGAERDALTGSQKVRATRMRLRQIIKSESSSKIGPLSIQGKERS